LLRLLHVLLFRRFVHGLTNGEADLAVLIHVNDFNRYHVINLQVLMNVFHIAVCDFGNMDEARNSTR